MDASVFLHMIVDRTLPWLENLAGAKATPEARVMVMAIAGQESEWRARRQLGGPARSYWQFEKGGGVAELFAVTPSQLSQVCAALDIPYDQTVVFEAMAWSDMLACSMARLLLWQDPKALPAIGQEEAAWEYYYRNWRPGAPDRGRWSRVYQKTLALLV